MNGGCALLNDADSSYLLYVLSDVSVVLFLFICPYHSLKLLHQSSCNNGSILYLTGRFSRPCTTNREYARPVYGRSLPEHFTPSEDWTDDGCVAILCGANAGNAESHVLTGVKAIEKALEMSLIERIFAPGEP